MKAYKTLLMRTAHMSQELRLLVMAALLMVMAYNIIETTFNNFLTADGGSQC